MLAQKALQSLPIMNKNVTLLPAPPKPRVVLDTYNLRAHKEEAGTVAIQGNPLCTDSSQVPALSCLA